MMCRHATKRVYTPEFSALASKPIAAFGRLLPLLCVRFAAELHVCESLLRPGAMERHTEVARGAAEDCCRCSCTEQSDITSHCGVWQRTTSRINQRDKERVARLQGEIVVFLDGKSAVCAIKFVIFNLLTFAAAERVQLNEKKC